MSRRYWYVFQPNGNVTVPGDYIITLFNPDNFCPGGELLCAIYAYGSGAPGSSPDSISSNLQYYIPLATSWGRDKYPELPEEPYVWSRASS